MISGIYRDTTVSSLNPTKRWDDKYYSLYTVIKVLLASRNSEVARQESVDPSILTLNKLPLLREIESVDFCSIGRVIKCS